MTEAVVVALITAASGVAVAVVGGIFLLLQNRRQKRRDAHVSEKLEVVREQVQNSHGTNLRDDLDRIADGLMQLGKNVEGLASDLRGVRRDIGRLDRRDIEDGADLRDLRQEFNRRVRTIEDTLNPKETP
ncbi:DUF2746 domain-containing protein [Leucobacter allii]|uniref:DUF2746 domain-containing protein n=1 Tax=Leucobacter allii TaxID=2932247 RepID=A0ABY4FPC9_9MICO|nr:DUF2746 domain-containing protein [Leucobacter allii]UOQ58086.1 DUF2746 domain-containing protein [Leucobacter allii]